MSEVTAVPLPPLRRGSLVKMWLALALLVGLAVALAWWGTAAWQVTILHSGVRVQTLHAGHGPEITTEDVIALRYKLHIGSLDSRVIQDSDESGQPFVATTAEVYPGFGEALQHMRAGGAYVITLPPGTHIQAPQPGAPFTPRDTLVFEVQIIQIAAGQAQAFEMQRMQQLQQELQSRMQQQGAPGGAHPGGGSTAPPAGTEVH